MRLADGEAKVTCIGVSKLQAVASSKSNQAVLGLAQTDRLMRPLADTAGQLPALRCKCTAGGLPGPGRHSHRVQASPASVISNAFDKSVATGLSTRLQSATASSLKHLHRHTFPSQTFELQTAIVVSS